MDLLEKINKLLDSGDLQNILLGVQLSYTLPFEEFHNLYYDNRPVKLEHGPWLYYRFERNGCRYGFGGAHFFRRDKSHQEDYNFDKIINITP